MLAMNQKNLNYEIETGRPPVLPLSRRLSMNQKNLNYEIETDSRLLRWSAGDGL